MQCGGLERFGVAARDRSVNRAYMSNACMGSFQVAGSVGVAPITTFGSEAHSRHDDRLPHAGLNRNNVTPSVRLANVLGLKAACARATCLKLSYNEGGHSTALGDNNSSAALARVTAFRIGPDLPGVEVLRVGGRLE
jgi:hypothetical protein